MVSQKIEKDMYPESLEPNRIFAIHETDAKHEIHFVAKLIRRHFRENEPYSDEWLVEDLRTGRREIVGLGYIGNFQLNAMEVLAWASK